MPHPTHTNCGHQASSNLQRQYISTPPRFHLHLSSSAVFKDQSTQWLISAIVFTISGIFVGFALRSLPVDSVTTTSTNVTSTTDPTGPAYLTSPRLSTPLHNPGFTVTVANGLFSLIQLYASTAPVLRDRHTRMLQIRHCWFFLAIAVGFSCCVASVATFLVARWVSLLLGYASAVANAIAAGQLAGGIQPGVVVCLGGRASNSVEGVGGPAHDLDHMENYCGQGATGIGLHYGPYPAAVPSTMAHFDSALNLALTRWLTHQSVSVSLPDSPSGSCHPTLTHVMDQNLERQTLPSEKNGTNDNGDDVPTLTRLKRTLTSTSLASLVPGWMCALKQQRLRSVTSLPMHVASGQKTHQNHVRHASDGYFGPRAETFVVPSIRSVASQDDAAAAVVGMTAALPTFH